MTAADKVTATHLERSAVVYVRQSTIAQVREHTESTARQYALAQEAARLGWSATRISVIDADLGVSGRTASARSGFKELVGRVCVGEVGAILGLDAVVLLPRAQGDERGQEENPGSGPRRTAPEPLRPHSGAD
jgi:Resolvase, N terminal domain